MHPDEIVAENLLKSVDNALNVIEPKGWKPYTLDDKKPILERLYSAACELCGYAKERVPAQAYENFMYGAEKRIDDRLSGE